MGNQSSAENYLETILILSGFRPTNVSPQDGQAACGETAFYGERAANGERVANSESAANGEKAANIETPVRAVDIAKELGYTKPSVSVAMKNLRGAGHIAIDPEGFITLTASGRAIAETMYERHVLISDWLIYLGVDKKTAVADACKMEHDISEQSFKAIKRHIKALRME